VAQREIKGEKELTRCLWANGRVRRSGGPEGPTSPGRRKDRDERKGSALRDDPRARAERKSGGKKGEGDAPVDFRKGLLKALVERRSFISGIERGAAGGGGEKDKGVFLMPIDQEMS